MLRQINAAPAAGQRVAERERLTTGRIWVAVVALVVLGACLRLWDLSLVEFRHDSAWWALDGQRILQGGHLPLIAQQVGSMSVPFYNGPFFGYLTALAFAVAGGQPLAMSAVVALCNAAAILLTFLLGRRLYSPLVGLLSAALMSVAPWLVLYGRMFWPQALFPLLMPLAFLTLLLAVERQRWGWYLLFGVLLGIGVQLHLSVLAVVGTGALYILLYGRPRLMVLVYAAGVALGYAPVLIYDLFNGFTNLRGILLLPALHATDEPRLSHMAKTIWNFSNVLSGQGLWVSKLSKTPFLPAWMEWAQGLLMTGLFIFAAVVVVTTTLRAAGSLRRLRLGHQDALLLLFIALPFLYLLLSRSLIQRHYFIFFSPLPLVLIARGVELWLRRQPALGMRAGALAPLAVLGACVALNLFTALAMLSFLRQSGGEGEYGTVLGDKEAAVALVVAQAGSNLAVDLRGVREALPFVYLFEARVDVAVEGEEATATALKGVAASPQPLRFRLVELPYAPLELGPGERVLFERRGVVVVQQP